MSPAAATFLCAIAGTRAVFLLFTFLLQYFSRTIARAHREREREREWPASDFYSARVQILASFLRPLVEQIFRRPRSSFAEEQTPNPPLAKGTANRFKRDRQSRYRSNVYQEGNENVGDLTDRAIFVEQRGHRLASSGQGALVLPPVPFSSFSRFRNAKITWMLEWLGPCFNCESTRIEEG